MIANPSGRVTRTCRISSKIARIGAECCNWWLFGAWVVEFPVANADSGDRRDGGDGWRKMSSSDNARLLSRKRRLSTQVWSASRIIVLLSSCFVIDDDDDDDCVILLLLLFSSPETIDNGVIDDFLCWCCCWCCCSVGDVNGQTITFQDALSNNQYGDKRNCVAAASICCCCDNLWCWKNLPERTTSFGSFTFLWIRPVRKNTIDEDVLSVPAAASSSTSTSSCGSVTTTTTTISRRIVKDQAFH